MSERGPTQVYKVNSGLRLLMFWYSEVRQDLACHRLIVRDMHVQYAKRRHMWVTFFEQCVNRKRVEIDGSAYPDRTALQAPATETERFPGCRAPVLESLAGTGGSFSSKITCIHCDSTSVYYRDNAYHLTNQQSRARYRIVSNAMCSVNSLHIRMY